MSFINTKYQTNAGTIVRVRISTDVAAVSGNTAPAGALDDTALSVSSAHMSARKGWTRARGVRVRRLIGTVGTGAAARDLFEFATITALTPAAQTAMRSAETITYAGQTWIPVSNISEG